MSYVHVNSPVSAREQCLVIDCPTCERMRRAFCADYDWYGSSVTCAGCGDSWNDGQLSERPFAPGWRDRARKYAIKRLKQIGIQA